MSKQKERLIQRRGPRTHEARIAIRKFNRDRRPQPVMTRKRAEMILSAWGTSEYARYYGIGPNRARIELIRLERAKDAEA